MTTLVNFWNVLYSPFTIVSGFIRCTYRSQSESQTLGKEEVSVFRLNLLLSRQQLNNNPGGQGLVFFHRTKDHPGRRSLPSYCVWAVLHNWGCDLVSPPDTGVSISLLCWKVIPATSAGPLTTLFLFQSQTPLPSPLHCSPFFPF